MLIIVAICYISRLRATRYKGPSQKGFRTKDERSRRASRETIVLKYSSTICPSFGDQALAETAKIPWVLLRQGRVS